LGFVSALNIETSLYRPKKETGPWSLYLLEAKNSQKPEVSTSLEKKIRGFYIACQRGLFPWVEEEFGLLPKRYQKLLLVFEMVCSGLSAPHLVPYAGAPAGVSGFACTVVSDQDGLEYSDNCRIARATTFGPTAPVDVRLVAAAGCAECVHIFPCVQGVCGV